MQKIAVTFVLLFLQMVSFANDTTEFKQKQHELSNAGLVLPKGFSAFAITDSVGKARHIKVTKNGVLYIKLSKLINIRCEDSSNVINVKTY